MATELYKEEDSRVYNIEVWKLLLNPLILSAYSLRMAADSFTYAWMDLRHWSYSETARYHKRQPRDPDKLAGLLIMEWDFPPLTSSNTLFALQNTACESENPQSFPHIIEKHVLRDM